MDDYQLDVFLHELKNPLTTLKVLAKLLYKRLGDGDPNVSLVLSMLHECERLEGMLRDPARDGERPGDLERFFHSHHPVYEALVGSYQQTLLWEVAALPALQSSPISTQHLRQILDNLILNACKFNPVGGRVRVTAAIETQALVITVSDTGSGIPAAALAHIFTPYQRFHADQPGQGLGLAIVKDLVENSNGTIEVSSLPGQGSQFRVVLPCPPPLSDVHEPTRPDFIGG